MNHRAHGEHGEHGEHREHREGDPPHPHQKLTRDLVDAGLKVHKPLGPGLLESAYEFCLEREFLLRSIAFRRQVAVPIHYGGTQLEVGNRLDMVVEDSIIIEIKAVESLTRLHTSQLLTYMKLSGYHIGLLMNFNVTLFKDGLKRFIL